MNLKISLLLTVALACPLCSVAQSARNPLNHEPARVSLQKGMTSWKLTEEVFYHADGQPFNKRNYQYDANGQKTTESSSRLNEDDRTWREILKSEYRYTDDKEVIINMSGAHFTSITEVVNDTEGKPLYALTYAWNSDADDWSVNPSMRSEWKYNDDGHMAACLKQQINRTTNEWNDFDIRISSIYNETGELTEETFQVWNPEQGQWTNKGRYTYSNIDDFQKAATSYIYAPSFNDWVFDGKTVYIYDEDGKIIRCDYYQNNTDKAPDAYSINTYSESAGFAKAPELNEINVFPNPAMLTFELTVPTEYIGKTMYLFDAWGKQEKAVKVPDLTTQVDISGLPCGVYLLKIGDLSKKIIIQ